MFDFGGSNKFDFGGGEMAKHIFKVGSHIQKNAQSPNPIFKITIYCKNYTNNAKIHSKLGKRLEKNEQFQTFQILVIYFI